MGVFPLPFSREGGTPSYILSHPGRGTKVRVIGAAAGLIDRLRKALRTRNPFPPHPVGATGRSPSPSSKERRVNPPPFVIPAKAGTHGGAAWGGLLFLIHHPHLPNDTCHSEKAHATKNLAGPGQSLPLLGAPSPFSAVSLSSPLRKQGPMGWVWMGWAIPYPSPKTPSIPQHPRSNSKNRDTFSP